MDEAEEARLTQRLINTLEPVVGANKIRASVNVDYDQGTTEESQEKYDPTVSALLSDQKVRRSSLRRLSSDGRSGDGEQHPVGKAGEAGGFAGGAEPDAVFQVRDRAVWSE